MFIYLFILIFITNILCEDTVEEFRIVELPEGYVRGEKYWNGDIYEFFGVPYATAPKGQDRFKPPLPVTPRKEILKADKQAIMCYQTFYTGEEEEEKILNGEEDCLVSNILVPLIANETNLVPVIVYIHSGAFSGGSANMGRLHYLARLGVVAINFNYRVGALGFACLGTEEIPGNAGLKDQLAALKWIKNNIAKFGGDPKRITLAGYSVGATMAELHAISKHTDGLFDKLILDSGSALAPFAINRHPITTAKNIALSLGYNGTNVKELTEFYLKASELDLAVKSLNFFMPNSTFGFAPCIESSENNPEPYITESPLETLKKGGIKKLAILSGFTNMEGLSRSALFGKWKELMNENFSDFLPADLIFKDVKTKEEVAEVVKSYYFKGDAITVESKQEYVDYFSDSMFIYPILKSLSLHAAITTRPVYVYEFSYFGQLSTPHNFMETIKGVTHRDQVSYIWDFFGFTSDLKDMDVRDRMTYMWTDFVKYEDPTIYESSLINIKWKMYSNHQPYYLSIDSELQMKEDPFPESYKFWNNIYKKYYWNPTYQKADAAKK
ncbi:unnamed protein product [Diatraea saccharalis]|uniref:Carboxylesterase type B domain-containing protein n=1 Tax=Diatraea saccharalis TaxID=40085 RepID=A0A9N9R3U3_9NEOP|nr:unnamed protein product [Diatraea saccharalis]